MRSIFLLPVILLACGRGSARISESCDCNDRTPEPDETGEGGLDSETGAPTDDTSDTSSGGGQQASEWRTYTVTCADEDTVAGEAYSEEVDLGVAPPMLIVQVWADLDPVEVEAGSCRSALRQAMPYGSGADLSFFIEADGTMLLECRKYGDGYHPDWCSGYDGWGPSSYTIHVLPLSSTPM